ncbi:ankyrin repeat domain-containing protein [Aspergillus melleus]|uniref:ankyrin repeat domain-containing protein n=1 Tax=Aspergillus melleus TaxID=138277 RepID=UPI001E8D3AF4|nr:uncharacterized protein LDX57_001879 [Aspergillus melleus]KAH8424125.1 hypothetical protein LDX57_001879 [Aspergillus melleus]
MTPALPDPLPTPDFSTLFDGSTVDLDLQYLDTNSSLPTTASSSTLHTPSGSTTSLSLPSTIGLPTPNFVSPNDLDIIMSPSDSYLHGISRVGSDDHEQTQRNEHQDLSLLPSFSLHLTGKERHDNDTNGWLSTLHLAVQKGHDSIIRVLLERNMDCNDPDSDGLTPLMHATIQGHERAVALLLSHGACAGKVDHLQRSVLHWAVLHRRDALLKIMLDRCSGEWRLIDGYDGAGRTPLHVAVEIGFDAGVEMLLQFGANLHHRVRKT